MSFFDNLKYNWNKRKIKDQTIKMYADRTIYNEKLMKDIWNNIFKFRNIPGTKYYNISDEFHSMSLLIRVPYKSGNIPTELDFIIKHMEDVFSNIRDLPESEKNTHSFEINLINLFSLDNIIEFDLSSSLCVSSPFTTISFKRYFNNQLGTISGYLIIDSKHYFSSDYYYRLLRETVEKLIQ